MTASEKRTILATSGGFVSTGRGFVQIKFGPLIHFALELSHAARPKFCYLGTATGDSAIGIRAFYGACVGETVDASHLQLFDMPNVAEPADHLLSQDVIWVNGGSVANLLAVWRAHGLDAIMREAWEQGIVLAGVSAGSICWHVGGPTDSFGPELRGVDNGLGLLPFSNGVHYDSEALRRPTFHALVGSAALPDGYATEDRVGLLYRGTELIEAVTDQPGKLAYSVTRRPDGAVDERPIQPRLLG